MNKQITRQMYWLPEFFEARSLPGKWGRGRKLALAWELVMGVVNLLGESKRGHLSTVTSCTSCMQLLLSILCATDHNSFQMIVSDYMGSGWNAVAPLGMHNWSDVRTSGKFLLIKGCLWWFWVPAIHTQCNKVPYFIVFTQQLFDKVFLIQLMRISVV